MNYIPLASTTGAQFYAIPQLVDPGFKMDEGFSEETRSQDEADTAATFESSELRAVPVSPQQAMHLVLALNEEERRGMILNRARFDGQLRIVQALLFL